MTEAEWLASDDPGMMAFFLEENKNLSERKLRLFGCACVRGVWRDLPEDALREAVETCERIADGQATAEELEAARAAADATYQGIGDIIADHSAIAVTALCGRKPWFPMGEGSAAGISAVAAEARFDHATPFHVARAQARRTHCELLRDIIGNPFRPRPPRKGKRLWKEQLKTWIRWNQGAVPSLAQAAYDAHTLPEGTLDPARLAVLADALEEAGCTEAVLLEHLRGPGPHVRGCWVLDLMLDRH
jgi:hypothetical protein